LAISGLLLSIGVPSYITFVRNARQVTSANELLATLHFARDLAITRNARITICPSQAGVNCDPVGWHEGWIVFIDNNGDRAVDVGEIIERAVAGLETPSIDSAEFGGFLIYRPNGRAMANTVAQNTGELALCDERGSSHARVLIIDMSGRPRVSKTTAGGDEPTCPSLG
jgi:type IV fimbrial biogenesis protein FimT